MAVPTKRAAAICASIEVSMDPVTTPSVEVIVPSTMVAVTPRMVTDPRAVAVQFSSSV